MIDKNDPRLTAFVLDGLDADQRLEIQAAIETSPDLQSEVAEIRRTVGLLGDMFDAEPALTLTDRQREVLGEEMNAVRNEVAKRPAPNSAAARATTKHVSVRFLWIAACIGGMLIAGSLLVLNWYDADELAKLQDLNTSVWNAKDDSTTKDSVAVKGGTDSVDSLDMEGEKRQPQFTTETLAEHDRRTEDTVEVSEATSGIVLKSESGLDELEDLIKSTIERDSWDNTSGDGQIQAYSPNLSMIVEQSQNSDGENFQLLEDGLASGKSGGGGGGGLGGDNGQSQFGLQDPFFDGTSSIQPSRLPMQGIPAADLEKFLAWFGGKIEIEDNIADNVVTGREPVVTHTFDGSTSTQKSTDSLLDELNEQVSEKPSGVTVGGLDVISFLEGKLAESIDSKNLMSCEVN